MPRTLTRETFISPDHAKIAATQAAMYNVTADGVEEVPVPASVRESGSIPDGYTVGSSFQIFSSTGYHTISTILF